MPVLHSAKDPATNTELEMSYRYGMPGGIRTR
jgi:hypothetical protein